MSKSKNSIQLSNAKISDLVKEKTKNNQKYFGVEISSKSCDESLDYNEFKTKPLFTSLVWNGLTDSILRISKTIESNGGTVLPHISCYQMTTEKLENILDKINFSNVLVIRGDKCDAEQEFKYASDMVKKLKELKTSSISVGVCGYPEVHPEANSMEEDLQNLKFKVECGADFIITQLCFSTERIIDFIKKCRKIGIEKFIIPGIFVPSSWTILKRMLEITKISIEDELLSNFKILENDDVKFKEYSAKIFTQMVQDILEHKDLNCNGVHFFTFNQFDVVKKIVNNLF